MGGFFIANSALAYGEGGGGGGYILPWFITTPTPTPSPTPNPNALSESGQYYKTGINVYENSSGRHVGLSEFQQLGLNLALLPSKTATLNPVAVARISSTNQLARLAPTATPTPTPGTSVQPSASPELPLTAAIGSNVQGQKTPNVLVRLFNWLFRRK